MSRSRRGTSGLSGVLVVDKPAGMTSHDVVATVRHSTGEGRVGHAGTLDPAATGVLVVLVGPATRLAPYLTGADKRYEARIVFGTQTDTDDAEGTPVRTAPIPAPLTDPTFAADTLSGLVGVHEQRPPSYSALKRGGVTAHRAARAGKPLHLETRSVEILQARLIGHDAGEAVAWEAEFTVSKGTYVRAIARDLGNALGTAAHLGALRRTASGALGLSSARTLEEVVAAGPHVAPLFADPVPALGLPVHRVGAADVARVGIGASLPSTPDRTVTSAGEIALADDERLWAVYRLTTDGTLRPVVVLAGGVPR